MDLRYTEAEQEFRDELRQWLADVLPGVPPEPARDDWARRRTWDTGWQKQLHAAGYAGINWPADYGGRGASPTEHLIFLEETERARAPYIGVNFVGLGHAGPTLIVEAQRGAEGQAPAVDPQRRPRVVPGLQRARRRQRPRGAELPRSP